MGRDAATDTTTDILAAMRADERAHAGRRRTADLLPRVGRGLVGIAQLLTAVPILWSAVDGHTLRDVGAFQLALAIGFSWRR